MRVITPDADECPCCGREFTVVQLAFRIPPGRPKVSAHIELIEGQPVAEADVVFVQDLEALDVLPQTDTPTG